MIGQTISHYRIVEKLGEGGMGIVYKAHDTKLNRTVALKFLPSHLGSDETEKHRFLHEAQAASALDHNNICSIYSIEETNEGNVFIVMAYYEGMSLKERIEKGPLPLKDVVNYSIRIATGLQKAHEKGIVHRDLKPANIFITNDDQVKLIDFGLARVAERTLLTKSGTTLGTVPYMSPEQAQGAKVDHRTDIWSLGVVLYEMITGQRPFKSDYETALVYSIINEEPEPVTGLRSGIPMELERILNKCLEKEPNDRYQHTDEMIVDLRKVTNEISSGVHAKTRAIKDKETVIDNNDRSYRKKIKPLVYAIPLVLIILLGIYVFIPREPAIAELDRSIAVLPFENLSPDPADEFIADGITEDIIGSLSKIADLRVISRRSSMRYKGTDKSLRTIGEELNIATILEGSVRRFGDALRISAQLIDIHTDNTLWAEHYDRRIEDIFVLQSEVAQNVAVALKAQLTPDEIERIEVPPTENMAAYEIFQKTRQRSFDINPQDINEAIEIYRRAIELDPEFALAYAELAFMYVWLWVFGEVGAIDSAREYVKRALDIDSKLSFAHDVLSRIRGVEGNLSEARRLKHTAIKYDPNFHWPMMDLGGLDYGVGRFDESLYWSLRALERAPDEAITYYHVGLPLLIIGDDERTERFLQIALDKEAVTGPFDLGPKPFWRIPILLANLEVFRGNYEQALEWIRDALELRPDNVELLRNYSRMLILTRSEDADSIVEALYQEGYASETDYASILMNRGDMDRAYTILDRELESLTRRYEGGHESPGVPLQIARIYSLRGNTEEALVWLERAYEMGYIRPRFLDVDPQFDNVRDHRRYRRLIERMHVDIERMKALADFSGLPGWEDYIAIK
jgi:eukaryotic-like serine/threonine-protein kinase